MTNPRVLFSRFHAWFLRARRNRELDDEIRFHLDMQAEDNRRAGMDPASAHYAALRNFGGVDPMKEAFRDRLTFARAAALLQDASHGLRLLRRRPGFTLAAGLSLALGIGFTVAIFSLLDAVALRPLPYPAAGRVLWITQVIKKNSTDELTFTPHFLEWRRQTRAFTALAGCNFQTRILTGAGDPLELLTSRASASLLPVLGVQPALGRNFLPREDYRGGDPVALLTDDLWRQRFAADPHIVGRPVTLDGAPFTVVGVLPPGFFFPGAAEVRLITPLAKDEAAELAYKSTSIIRTVIGRLAPGVTPAQAAAELSVIQSRLPVPPFRPLITLKILPLRTWLFGDVAAASTVLLAAAVFLLLISSANVGNLLLARWLQRGRELAIRSALGGSRARLLAQLLTESAMLGILSCAAGVALAFWVRRPLLALNPYRLPGVETLPFDGRVAAFAILLGLLTTLLFGLLPAFRATRASAMETIRAGEAAVVGGRNTLRLLSLIAAAEIAVTLVLSAGAGLMLQSFWKMRYRNLGFQPDRLVAATLHLTGPAYRDSAPRRAAFTAGLLARVRNLPGVELAAVARAGEIPPGDFHATNTFAIEGRDQPLGGSRPIARYPVVSPGYFPLLGIPLLEGRLLLDSDASDSLPVVVVNQALARRYFSSENPLGRRLRLGPDTQPWRVIVGIVADVKTSGLTTAPEPTVYMSASQADPSADLAVILRSPLSAGLLAAAFRQAVAALDPTQPVASIQSMNDRLSDSVSLPRFTALLLLAFASLAVLLGAIGVYGVMGCRVRWQLREFAVRQALGARPSDVLRHVMRQGLAIVLPGLFVGLCAALALGRLLAGLLYDVSPRDPLTLAALSAGLAAVALLACCIPALRAAGSDPLPLLRRD